MSNDRRRFLVRQVQAAAVDAARREAEAAQAAGVPATLRERIAAALGWTVAETHRVSFWVLRELLRPVSPKLADAVSEVIRDGSCIVGEPKGRA